MSEGVFPLQSAFLLEDVRALFYGEFGESLFLLDLAGLLTNIILLIGIDHLLSSLGSLPLPRILLCSPLLLRRLFFLLRLLGRFFFHRFLSDILIPKINEIALVALLGFLEDILSQLMGIEHVLRLLLDLVSVVVGGLVHHSDFVLLLFLHEFFVAVWVGEGVLRRRGLVELIDIYLINYRHHIYNS